MWVFDFLAPPSCAFCGTPGLAAEKNVCAGCFQDLPWNVPAILSDDGMFERKVAMLHYAFPVDVAIKALKFHRKLFYAPALAEVLCVAAPMLPSDIDGILPVPLHWRRETVRGFNQATELAKPVAKVLGAPIVRSVKRRKATRFQSGLDAPARANNLRRAFVASGAQRHRHVLIIDDIVTTGATIEAVAKVLLAAGVGKVSALAVARAGVPATTL